MNTTIIKTDQITKAVNLLCLQANYFLPEDVFNGIKNMYLNEKSELGKTLLEDIISNAYLALNSKRPMCQDTGLTVIFIEIGQNVHIQGKDLTEAINDGVKQAYSDGYLRKSVVDDPIFNRINTKTNTPAVIHTKIVPGNEIKIIVAPKGGGSENMSTLKMLKPAEGVDGVVNFVIDSVKIAGANPCPPINVGVGVGGSFEQAAICAKKALLNPIIPLEELEEKAKTDQMAAMELRILKGIQDTGIGTQGLGGTHTAFGVSVETYPCHIASMPVAVNINCHAARHAEMILTDSTVIPDDIKPQFEIPQQKGSEGAKDLRKVSLPLKDEDITNLKAGECILLNGYMYTGRDAAHKRLLHCVKTDQPLPVDLKGQTIYYVGPCPAKEGEVIGPAGPTTSGRMDAYTPEMLKLGLKGMIGKGYRNNDVIDAIKKYKAVYFVSTGGAGALLAQRIKEAEIVAYEDLGPEAIYKLKIEDFPVTVCIDSEGNNFYEIGKAQYEVK